jgi:hypothetical protein
MPPIGPGIPENFRCSRAGLARAGLQSARSRADRSLLRQHEKRPPGRPSPCSRIRRFEECRLDRKESIGGEQVSLDRAASRRSLCVGQSPPGFRDRAS